MPPAPDLARNISLLGHTDQGGRGDGVQVMVGGGYAYVGHMFSGGVTVVDVRDPRRPEPVAYLPAAPGTWNLHLQLAEGLLLVVNAVDLFAAEAFADESAYYGRSVGEVLASQPPPEYRAGMQVFDLADPAVPREIGFLEVEGFGLHRIWWVGGRWAYASALLRGFSDYVLVTIDLADPARPRLAGRAPLRAAPRHRRRHVGLRLLARRRPDRPRRLRPGRPAAAGAPVSISTLPTPAEVDYCAKGGHFGPHNLHENRPGSFVSDQLLFATYQNAGVRVFDLADPFAPQQVGAFVPPAPERLYDTRPNRPKVIQSCDVFVDRDGVMYVTDYNAGLYLLQYEPGSS